MRKQNPSPQSKTNATPSVWLFDVDKLRAGDVVLERGSGVISRAIRTADRGEYSHALIFLGGTDFLEAVDIGARIISYVRVPIVEPSDWVVLRHPDAETARLAASKARNLAHKEYGTAAALQSILPFRFKDDPSRLFCSQLVAEAYQRAGATLVKGKETRQVTPKLLDKSSTLKRLQKIPLLKPINRNIPPLNRDAGYANSATAQDMQAAQNAFKSVQPELKRLIRAFKVSPTPGSLIDVFAFLKQAETRGAHQEVAPLMKALEQALEHEDYFELYPPLAIEAEAAFSRDLEHAKSQNATALERDDIARQSAQLARTYGETLSRHEANAQWFQNAFDNSRAPLWSRLAQMSREAAKATQKLIGIAQEVSDKCASMRRDKLE
jgi:Permuted papain-like amidase enzyme, YaeF/YiiX, C92 family